MKSLREQIAELEDPAPKDFDPESIDIDANVSSDSDGGRSPSGATAAFDGREHYEDVAPSTLRRPVKPVLGKRYAGSQVRRQDLGNEDENEDLTSGEDEEADGAEEPFATMDLGNEHDRSGTHSASEIESAGSERIHSEGRKMRILSVQVPESEDEEIDSDEAFGDDDDAGRFEGFKFLGSRERRNSPKVDSEEEDLLGTYTSGQEADEMRINNGADISGSDDDSDEDVDMMGDSDSEPTSDISDTSLPVKRAVKQPALNGDRAALKALLASDTAAVASSLSAAASADTKKGRAVKAQHQTFDRLLDVRIKLQKGLTAANSVVSGQEPNEHNDAINRAEEAALSLWNTITSIRHSFAEAQVQNSTSSTEKKRKRSSPATISTPLGTLWSETESLTATMLPHHRYVLNKWSAKVRASNPVATQSTSRLLGSSNNRSQNSITSVIDAYIATEAPKLIAQSTTNPLPSTTSNPTKAPHSPIALNQPNPNSPPPHYDDTPFYQSLLRDLISSRHQSQSLPSSSTTPTLPSKLHPSGSLSHSKCIDTKASKGRKVRYTVHERLQNFMAAEGGSGGGGGGPDGVQVGVGGTWREEARREFFASLMGGSRLGVGVGGALDEDEEVGEWVGKGAGGGGDGEEDRAEGEALRLFRS